MTSVTILPITKKTDLHCFEQHIDSLNITMEDEFFIDFKKRIESDSASNLIVLPRTRLYKMSIFDAETKILQAYYNSTPDEKSDDASWRILESNTYLQLVLPYYNQGTHHLCP